MNVTVIDAYPAELEGMRLLRSLPRPQVPFAAETIGGAFCLWRTNGDGAHLDNVRLDPASPIPVIEVLEGIRALPYDPDTDFYNAPEIMTTIVLSERRKVISAATILPVDGVADVWSVCTDESERGRGAASAVVHACLLEAHRQGSHCAVLGSGEELARQGGLDNRVGFETVGHEHGWTLRNVDGIGLPA